LMDFKEIIKKYKTKRDPFFEMLGWSKASFNSAINGKGRSFSKEEESKIYDMIVNNIITIIETTPDIYGRLIPYLEERLEMEKDTTTHSRQRSRDDQDRELTNDEIQKLRGGHD
ncbi:MAG: hypothetical protein WKF87_22530, partial [Chryseolinea sp.]